MNEIFVILWSVNISIVFTLQSFTADVGCLIYSRLTFAPFDDGKSGTLLSDDHRQTPPAENPVKLSPLGDLSFKSPKGGSTQKGRCVLCTAGEV